MNGDGTHARRTHRESKLQHCLPLESKSSELFAAELLGQPLSIRQVAALLGCSMWTARQRLLPLGLPHFRIARTGKSAKSSGSSVRTNQGTDGASIQSSRALRR